MNRILYETTKPQSHKRMLIVGIVLFAIQHGICSALPDEHGYVRIINLFAWFLMFCFITLLAIHSKKATFSAPMVVRFIIVSVLGLTFIWFSPWIDATSVSAASELGVLVLIVFRAYLTVAFFAATFFCVGYFSILPGKIITRIEVIRFLLVTLLSAVIGTILALALIFLFQSIPSFPTEAFFFFDGLISQLCYGITYYYVISLLLADNKVDDGY